MNRVMFMSARWDMTDGRLVVHLPATGVWDLMSSDGLRLVRFVGAGEFEVDSSVLVAKPQKLILRREGFPAYRLIPWRVKGGDVAVVFIHGLLRCEIRDYTPQDKIYGCDRKRVYWDVWKRVLPELCEGCDIWEFVYPSHWSGSDAHASALVKMLGEEGLLEKRLLLVGHSFGGIVAWRASHKVNNDVMVVGVASPYRGTPLVDFFYASRNMLKMWFGEYAEPLLAFRAQMFATGNSVISPAHTELFWKKSPLNLPPPNLLVSPWLEVTSDIHLLLETLRDASGETLVSARLITVLGNVAFGEDLSYNDGVVPMRSSGDRAFGDRCNVMHVSGDHETPLISEGVVRGVWEIISKRIVGGEV